ncbi:unnamed protein product [Haemonchus placei]|uniref:TIMELESS domain-containing protein n=1 Tax=Haemonchus placei TaxID=6290 RepID=A0A0N4X3B7_HAEPC|nr:unnamed protein product [Haemonchus placei]
MEVLIQGTISALGYLEDGVYYQEPDCYETIRDLIRFLRTDNNLLLARKICGERNIIENDLIPIIKSDDLKDNMFDITLRLLANLTQPAIVSLQGKQPEDRDEWQTYWTLEENLRRAKLAFADVKFFAVLKKKLEKYFMETDWEDRLEEDRLVMERIIVLLRYIFSISPTEGDGRRTAAESNSHDRVIMAFLESGIDKVLTHIAMQSKEQEFHLSIMVIFALILKEHKPADIASAGRGRTQAEKEQAEEELRQVVETEKAKLNAKRRKILASRHPRFFGSYVVKGLSAVNKEKDLVVLKPLKDVNELTFQAERKRQKTIAKNRRPFDAELKTHLSSMELRFKLKECLEEDLSRCFNRMMKSSREMAFDTRLSAGQKNADMYFFLLMRFMLEYTRLAGRPSSIVSVCLPVESFHHIQVHLDNYLESAAALNKEAKSFGLRAQHALSAYKELILFHLHLLDKGSPEEKEFAKRTCYHILTVEEYREMGIVLIRKFKV